MLKFKSNLQNLSPNTEHKSSVWPLAAIFKFWYGQILNKILKFHSRKAFLLKGDGLDTLYPTSRFTLAAVKKAERQNPVIPAA